RTVRFFDRRAKFFEILGVGRAEVPVPRLNLADIEFLAAVSREVLQIHLLRRRAVTRTQNEVAERIRGNGHALPRVRRKLHAGRAIRGKGEPRAKRSTCRGQSGLRKKTPSCAMQQSAHSLSDSTANRCCASSIPRARKRSRLANSGWQHSPPIACAPDGSPRQY